jgi:drug/metabolite transporter (DMT)-like permease
MPGPSQSVPRAILLMCLAWAMFTGIDATGKYLMTVKHMPAAQVVWVRFVGQFAAVVLALGLFAIPRLLRTSRPWHQALRSLLLLGSTVLNFLALRHLRLDQATTIMFLTPLTVALLAGPILGEWAGWRRLVAIGVGFAGILVALRPGYATFEPAFILAFGCMLVAAVFGILTRFLAHHDSAETTLFWSLLAGTILAAPLALLDWHWPADSHTWLLVATIGIWAAAGHWIFILAYRCAPAPVVAPFVYVSLITQSTAGFLVFGHVPDGWTLAGAAIVIASGVYVWHRERVRAREARQPA